MLFSEFPNCAKKDVDGESEDARKFGRYSCTLLIAGIHRDIEKPAARFENSRVNGPSHGTYIPNLPFSGPRLPLLLFRQLPRTGAEHTWLKV
jgi:hypothetical protein